MFFLERRIIISQSRENNRSPNMDNYYFSYPQDTDAVGVLLIQRIKKQELIIIIFQKEEK